MSGYKQLGWAGFRSLLILELKTGNILLYNPSYTKTSLTGFQYIPLCKEEF